MSKAKPERSKQHDIRLQKNFEIEIINEFQSAIHSKMLNYVLNNELDKSDSTKPTSKFIKTIIKHEPN
nr:hypothetical protein [Enterococcus durans]